MHDLFSPTDGEQLAVPGAEIRLYRAVDLPDTPDSLLAGLIRQTDWRQEPITLWGKTHMQPRLLCWQGEANVEYRYSGTTLVAAPFGALVLKLKTVVETLAGEDFNSVLLNYYRDNNDCMGFHSDDEPELGARPVIASLSLGTTRTFILKDRAKRGLKPVKIPLASGSLLVMRGDTQQNWKHGINRETARCGPRVNLTFRTIRSL